jgi:hypothetical protein
MKLEYKIKEGFFIAPKTYYNLTNDNEEIIKSKGLNLDINSAVGEICRRPVEDFNYNVAR